LVSPHDPRNDRGKAFKDEKYKILVHDEAEFEAIAKGQWSTAKEDASWMSGFRRYGASKLFTIMMIHELQRRLDLGNLNKVCVLGVDPGAMITGMQRHAPWIIRVFLFKFVYPLILRLSPNNEMVRAPSRSASDVLAAALGTAAGDLPKDRYLDGRKPFESSAESRDAEKCKWVWKKTASLAQLKQGETVLEDWQ
jgi:hypothetical protein